MAGGLPNSKQAVFDSLEGIIFSKKQNSTTSTKTYCTTLGLINQGTYRQLSFGGRLHRTIYTLNIACNHHRQSYIIYTSFTTTLITTGCLPQADTGPSSQFTLGFEHPANRIGHLGMVLHDQLHIHSQTLRQWRHAQILSFFDRHPSCYCHTCS